MDSLKFSISDLKLDEFLDASSNFFYDVRTRRGSCRYAECYTAATAQSKLVSLDMAIFEFHQGNHKLFFDDEKKRILLLGEQKKLPKNLGDDLLLAVAKDSDTSGMYYYSILVENFVFRMVFGIAGLEEGDEAHEMLHPIIIHFLSKHENIGLRT